MCFCRNYFFVFTCFSNQYWKLIDCITFRSCHIHLICKHANICRMGHRICAHAHILRHSLARPRSEQVSTVPVETHCQTVTVSLWQLAFYILFIFNPPSPPLIVNIIYWIIIGLQWTTSSDWNRGKGVSGRRDRDRESSSKWQQLLSLALAVWMKTPRLAKTSIVYSIVYTIH